LLAHGGHGRVAVPGLNDRLATGFEDGRHEIHDARLVVHHENRLGHRTI
jgi:hypothetical protein